MDELTQTERLTIAALVDGMQAQTRSRRKASRQGWAFFATAVITLPIMASALEGGITLLTAVLRISLALLLTTVVMTLGGQLFDSYQAQAATRSVEEAVEESRRVAREVAAAETAAESARAAAEQLNDRGTP